MDILAGVFAVVCIKLVETKKQGLSFQLKLSPKQLCKMLAIKFGAVVDINLN